MTFLNYLYVKFKYQPKILFNKQNKFSDRIRGLYLFIHSQNLQLKYIKIEI